MKAKIHILADVQSETIGNGTSIWQYCVILKGAKIGNNCNINCNVFIENDVLIGDDVTIKPGVQVWDGVTIGNKVMIGPNVTFTNDRIPISKNKEYKNEKTVINESVSIGANSTILCGIEIGTKTLIGAGSVLTKNTLPYTVWYGNPALHQGYITEDSCLLSLDLIDRKTGEEYCLEGFKPVKK
ncbi:acyltransferase [Pedobacter endophyticus]|uniref:N-acetyltransferase n=1 Tax=Pedobacter endophyticus TaxID=2789740 RepID=A0A7U3Q5W9_9SPHI|nr:acyltransferase [Pedobacter endophyticus]QPH38347.1 N-acetyltransferase [Pedobacter endophyticus]